MGEIVVIAEEELVLAFRLVGVEGIAVAGREEALAAFGRLTARTAGPRPRILVVTDEVAGLLEAELRDWQLGGDYPLVVEIPPQAGRAPGRRGIADAVREAIGVAI